MNHKVANWTRVGLNPLSIVLLLALLVVFGCSDSKSQLSTSNDLFLKGQELLAAGDKAKALEAFDQSIAAEPALWTYRERAKLHAEMGNDKAALEDCEAALKLEPDDPDTLWLKAEFAKPAAQRFQGNSKKPPSSNR